MNFAYGVIVIVGVLAAIVLGFIAAAPDDIVEPRIIPVEEKPTVCTLEWDPMCGVDGETYGNLCMLDAADVKLDYDGECVIAQPEPEAEPEPEPEPESVTSAVPAPPETHTVEAPEGSGAPGCEETDECFIPYSLQIRVGDTVIWNNVDTAAHTVTSGSIEEGPSEVFDSSLFMSGSSFEFTFDEAGEYPYFCVVHPWMTGEVVVSKVEEMVVVSEPTAVAEPEPKVEPEPEVEPEPKVEPEPEVEPEPKVEPEPASETLPMALTVSAPEGSGVPGCEETNECFLPYEVTVAVGATVTWSNDDTAAHTVTSGTISDGVDGLFDSSIFMSGTTFEFTFDDAGSYDYFCMVHPWMTGIVHVS